MGFYVIVIWNFWIEIPEFHDSLLFISVWLRYFSSFLYLDKLVQVMEASMEFVVCRDMNAVLPALISHHLGLGIHTSFHTSNVHLEDKVLKFFEVINEIKLSQQYHIIVTSFKDYIQFFWDQLTFRFALDLVIWYFCSWTIWRSFDCVPAYFPYLHLLLSCTMLVLDVLQL